MRKILTILAFCFLAMSATCQTTHSAALSWQPSSTPNVTYNVLKASSQTGPFTSLQTGVTGLTFTDANLPANTQECYEVIVQSANNQDSDPTIPVCGSTLKDKAAPAGAVVVVFQ